jgi:5'-deoxynucleotidase YfbR-like HD superfamily hydrolase
MPTYGRSDSDFDDIACTNIFSSVPCQDKKCPVHNPPPQVADPQGTMKKFPFLPVTIPPHSPKHWFQTFTGKLVDAENPTPEMVDIEDIAHALSMTCRFGGHCHEFYSVAEHSFLVLQYGGLPPALAFASSTDPNVACARLALLLHDAAEAYIQDIITPVKCLLKDIEPLERKWLEAIEQKFDLQNRLSLPGQYIKDADLMVLCQEVTTLFSPVLPEWWVKFGTPSKAYFFAGGIIQCWSPAEARRRFLHAFQELQLQRGISDPWTKQP